MVIFQNILKFSESLVKTEIYCYDVAFAKTTKSNFGLLALFKEVQGDKECLTALYCEILTIKECLKV